MSYKKYYKSDNRKNFYTERMITQNSRCAICGNEERLVIDHDHTTGMMRGLLCHRHNTALGLFNDNPLLLKEAASYLECYRPEALQLLQIAREKTNESKIIQMLLDDFSYPSDRARARELAKISGCSEAAAQSKIRRERLRPPA